MIDDLTTTTHTKFIGNEFYKVVFVLAVPDTAPE